MVQYGKKRNSCAALAQEALETIRKGWYLNAGGASVDIAAAVACSRENSLFIPAADSAQLECAFREKDGTASIELHGESMFAGILRLSGQEIKPFGVLNLASAKNPGGGFLNGALAQEESLAATSSLYGAQMALPEYS